MGRRPKGDGSIFQRSDGYFVGRYKGKVVYGKTKTEARDKLNELKAKIDSEFEPAETTLIKDAMGQWLTHKSLSLKATSIDRLEGTVRTHIIPYVGNMECQDFTEKIFIQKILNRMMADGLSFSSIKKSQDAVCAFCKWGSASSRRYMKSDPMVSFEKITRAGIQDKDSEANTAITANAYMNEDERERFNLACKSKYGNGNARFKYGEHFILMMYTGMRLGEMLALKWDNVNLDEKYIRINSNLTMSKDRNVHSKTFGKTRPTINNYTKNNRPRIIPLGELAIDAIQAIKKNSKPNAIYVTENVKGGVVLPCVFSAMLSRVFDLSGINIREGTNVHALRHTFASMCFAAGIPVRTISELLGHSSVQITMDIYIHLMQKNSVIHVPEIMSLK